MSERGAPLGNQNAAKGKRWSAAIDRALERKANGSPAPDDVSDLIRGMDQAADLFVSQLFENKDISYFKEFGDRVEGKAAQSMQIDADVRQTLVQATTEDEKA